MHMLFLLFLPGLLLLALLSFLFSLSETSIIGLSKIKLHHMLSRGIKNSKKVQQLITQSDKLIVTILVGNNFVNIAFSVLVSAFLVKLLGEQWGVVLATFLTAAFILIFCEILPKMLALKNTERMALFVAPIMNVGIRLLNPVSRIFMRISDGILKILRIELPKRSPLITEEELRLMIEVGKETGVLTEEERGMLHRIFEFGDTRVEEVMIPRAQMVAASISSSAEQLLDIFAEEGHSRIPVYKGSLDTVVGVIYARDLIYTMRDKGLFVVQDLVHRVYSAPAGMRVNELLRKFQAEKMQIAIVVGPDNKTLGVVTLEDLIEEIVGEIEEQHTPAAK